MNRKMPATVCSSGGSGLPQGLASRPQVRLNDLPKPVVTVAGEQGRPQEVTDSLHLELRLAVVRVVVLQDVTQDGRFAGDQDLLHAAEVIVVGLAQAGGVIRQDVYRILDDPVGFSESLKS
jgi:hypothetical protein